MSPLVRGCLVGLDIAWHCGHGVKSRYVIIIEALLVLLEENCTASTKFYGDSASFLIAL